MNRNYVPYTENRVTRLLRNQIHSQANFQSILYVTDLVQDKQLKLFDLFTFTQLRKLSQQSNETETLMLTSKV